MYRQAVLLLCCLCGLPAVQANEVSVWYRWPPDAECVAGDDYLVITSPGTFKIEAREGTELGYIDSITVDFTGDPGPVTIFICAEDHEELPGATNVWRVDLTGAEPGVVDTMRITDSLGHSEYASALLADSAGTISIGSGATGDIVKPVHILGDLDSLTVRGAILPEVTVDGDVGTLSIGTLSGEFRITSGNLTGAASVTDLHGCFDVAAGDVTPPENQHFYVATLAGTLTIAGDLAGGDGLRVDDLRPQGLIEIGGSVLSTVRFNPYMSGTLHVVGGPDHSGGILAPIECITSAGEGADVTGQILVDGCLDSSIHAPWDLTYTRLPTESEQYGGRIVISGAVTAKGSITIGQDVNGGQINVGSLAGNIQVARDVIQGGDLTGSIAVQGDVHGAIGVTGDLTGGHIIVNGSLTEEASIVVGGEFAGDPPDTEFIAIDYDGWDEADTWESGAVIEVDEEEYTENTPDAHVWEITSCKADMNNNESVDFFDIDPFVQALNYPDEYALDYPGLAGSMVFHGDLNCDGYFDFFDIDPFVARIFEECCDEECGPCPERFGGEGGGEWLSPLELAIELATHIAPERYDTLVDMIALLAAAQKDAEKAAYWTAVWAALRE